MTKLSEDLAWRGLVKDKTFTDVKWLDSPRFFYLGIDASADSLTVGNLAVLMLAKRLAAAGWKAVMLAGGATSLVGDPGGKDKERELLPSDQIEKNVAAISAQIEKIMNGSDFEMANNLDWLGDVKLLDFLRDTGKAFPMNELMQREFVTERLSTGISYAEFSYSLLQGYDYWWLNHNKAVELQIGASDQWANMLSGVSLVRKKAGKVVHAMSMPLVVNRQTGVKFGKSEAGAIWLDQNKTASEDFYQFWLNTSDGEVQNFLKIFTLLDQTEIESIMRQHQKDASKRAAQHALAEAVTAIVHPHGVGEAKSAAESLVEGNPAKVVSLPAGSSLVDALVKSGLSDSNSDARRVIDEGGVYINNKPLSDDNLPNEDSFVLRRGKKLSNSVLIKLN